MRHPLQELEQLQSLRGRKPRDLGIGGMIAAAETQATRTHKRLGELIELWQELLPPALVSHTVLVGVNRGVLNVKVDSAATAFELDRLLRSGVEKELRSRFRGTLSRVKTRVEPLDGVSSEPRESQARTPAASAKKVGARAGRR